MKRIHLTVMILASALALHLFTACGSPGDGTRPRHTSDRAGDGSILLHLPEALFPGISAQSVTTPLAIESTDVLEIVVLEATDTPVVVEQGALPTIAAEQTIQTQVASAPTVEFELPAGLYRILVLAGKQSGSTAVLLGSGATAVPVEVVPDAVTEATISMQTITHTIDHPLEVPAGDDYTIQLAGDTNNPFLTLLPTGETSTYYAQHRMDDDSSYSSIDLTITGGAWNADVAMTAAAVAGETGWRFSGPYVTYYDEYTGAYTALDGVFPLKWRWLSATVVTDSSPLWPEVWKPLTITSATTGVAITVDWS